MDFDRKAWKRSFVKDDFPLWHCSICNVGVLKADFKTDVV